MQLGAKCVRDAAESVTHVVAPDITDKTRWARSKVGRQAAARLRRALLISTAGWLRTARVRRGSKGGRRRGRPGGQLAGLCWGANIWAWLVHGSAVGLRSCRGLRLADPPAASPAMLPDTVTTAWRGSLPVPVMHAERLGCVRPSPQGKHVVGPNWLWCCAYTWQRADEAQFPVKPGGGTAVQASARSEAEDAALAAAAAGGGAGPDAGSDGTDAADAAGPTVDAGGGQPGHT